MKFGHLQCGVPRKILHTDVVRNPSPPSGRGESQFILSPLGVCVTTACGCAKGALECGREAAAFSSAPCVELSLKARERRELLLPQSKAVASRPHFNVLSRLLVD